MTPHEAPNDGKFRVLNNEKECILEHDVQKGDIWRLCRVKENPVKDWVKLAIKRAKLTGWPVVFWLDKNRAHDANLIGYVESVLSETNTEGCNFFIKSVPEAARYTLESSKWQEYNFSYRNVLRDYLTDLFPILELGTSAKMLSIVPLINGGGFSKPEQAGQRQNTFNNSKKRDISGGTRWESS